MFTKLKIFTFLMLFSLSSFGDTISKNELIGSWVDSWTLSEQVIPAERRMQVRNFLTVSDSLEFSLSRVFDSGTSQVMKSDDVKFVGDVVIAEFTSNQISFKLILSGWSRKSGRLIFGHLYLYNEGGLFNGVPVAFAPEPA